MRPPAVSVIVPFRNAAPTLAAAVDSIVRQTSTDWEMILFDDGSSDDGSAIAEKYTAEDDRIRVVSSAQVRSAIAITPGTAKNGQ